MDLTRNEIQAFDKLPISFWASNGSEHNYSIAFWSHGAAQIYGISRSEAVGQSFVELFVQMEQRGRAMQDCDDIIAGHKPKLEWINGLDVDQRPGDSTQVALLTHTFRITVDGEPYQAEIAIDLSPSNMLGYMDSAYLNRHTGIRSPELRTLSAYLEHVKSSNGRKLRTYGQKFAHDVVKFLAPSRRGWLSLRESRTWLPEEAERVASVTSGIDATFDRGEKFLRRAGKDDQTFLRLVEEKFDIRAALRTAVAIANSEGQPNIQFSLEIDESASYRGALGGEEEFQEIFEIFRDNSIVHAARGASPVKVEVSLGSEHDFYVVRIDNPTRSRSDLSVSGGRDFHESREVRGLSIAQDWVRFQGGDLTIDDAKSKAGIFSVELYWPRL